MIKTRKKQLITQTDMRREKREARSPKIIDAEGWGVNLSDFGVTDCPGGVCRVDFSRRPVSDDELRDVQRAWMLRGRRGMSQGDESFWKARILPLAARLDIEPGLILISPMLQRWD